MFISAGDIDALNPREIGEQRIEICGKKIHYGYIGGGVNNDIALLELCDQVQFRHGIFIRPARNLFKKILITDHEKIDSLSKI